MKKIYTPKHIQFLKKNIKGRSYADMTRLFNKRFSLSVSLGKIKSLQRHHKLTNGLPHGRSERKYLDKHLNYLRKIAPGTPRKTILKMFNKKFGFHISSSALYSLCGKYKIRNGINSGIAYGFKKGHVPFNKGKKGCCAPGSEKGWFKKGHRPAGWKPVGSERVTVDGYVEVKISDITTPIAEKRQRNWKMKHVIIWEKANGQVPKGHIVIFLDGNKLNFALNNLMMLSRQVHAVMCHMNWYTNDMETTKANCIMAQIKVKNEKKKRKTFKAIKNKKMIFLKHGGYKVFVIQDSGRYIPVRETNAGNLVRLWVKRLKSRASRGEAQRDLYEYAKKRGWQRI
jgi:hypothetical protein